MTTLLREYQDEIETLHLPILSAWSKDLKESVRLLTPNEVRFLVDYYYTTQEYRISTANQVRQSEGEPNAVIDVLFDQSSTVELRIKQALDLYTKAHPVGAWLQSVHGIGPVISAGLLAHIDITKCITVGDLWSFAGLNPQAEWKKGQKRPWNARLKVLCWKAGESFVKVSGSDKGFYGKVYLQRKAYEVDRNERGEYAQQATAMLQKKNIGKETEAYGHYSSGKLPPAHIHSRSKRYAVKLFLAHLQEVWWFTHYQTLPVRPYVYSHLEHAHETPPPHLESIPGLREAREKAGLVV